MQQQNYLLNLQQPHIINSQFNRIILYTSYYMYILIYFYSLNKFHFHYILSHYIIHFMYLVFCLVQIFFKLISIILIAAGIFINQFIHFHLINLNLISKFFNLVLPLYSKPKYSVPKHFFTKYFLKIFVNLLNCSLYYQVTKV